jgi:hypothetical protein
MLIRAKNILRNFIQYKNINECDKIIIALFFAVLSFSFVVFLLHPPKSPKPSIDQFNKNEISTKITNSDTINGSFIASKDNFTDVYFYFTTNIKAQPKNSPLLSITITDERGNIVYSGKQKIIYLDKNTLYDVQLKNPIIQSEGKQFNYILSLEKPLSPDNYVALWKDKDNNLIISQNYIPSEYNIFKQYLPLYLPSFFIIIILLIMVGKQFFKFDFFDLSGRQLLVLMFMPFLFLNGIFFMAAINHPAPIDEQSHFQVIKTITDHWTLPLLTKYDGISPTLEAFQPPLYYITSAVLTFPFKNFEFQKTLLRIFGDIQYVIFVFLSFLIYLRIAKKFKQLDNPLAISFFILFVGLIPALIVRSVCISNGTFSYMFIGIQILLLLFYLDSDEEKLSKRYLLALSVASGLSLLSRFTNLLTIPIILLAVALKEKFDVRTLAKFAAIILVILSPWFLWNLKYYHALTPNNAAMDYQKKTVNPDNEKFGLQYVIDNNLKMFNTVSIAEDYGLYTNTIGMNIVLVISYAIMASIFFGIIYVIMNVKKIFNPKNKEFYITILLSLFLFNVLQQMAIVIMDNWPVMLGRYLHGTIFVPALLIALFMFSLKKVSFSALVAGFFSISLVVLNIIYLTVILANIK